jgi:hypothetical protein
MARSSAYWAGNRYADPAREPEAAAPLHDLPAPAAARFRLLRDGLRALPGVGETVRYMGQSWRWAWEYGIGNRKLCWIHIIGDVVSTTFTLSDAEVDRVGRLGRLSADITRAIAEAQRTGPVRWCWLELADRRAIEAYLRFMRHKGAWLAERPAPHRAPRARGRKTDELDAD